jgi:hypothetical protein
MLQMLHVDISKVDRSGVAHAAMTLVASERRPATWLHLLPHAFLARRARGVTDVRS